MTDQHELKWGHNVDNELWVEAAAEQRAVEAEKGPELTPEDRKELGDIGLNASVLEAAKKDLLDISDRDRMSEGPEAPIVW